MVADAAPMTLEDYRNASVRISVLLRKYNIIRTAEQIRKIMLKRSRDWGVPVEGLYKSAEQWLEHNPPRDANWRLP